MYDEFITDKVYTALTRDPSSAKAMLSQKLLPVLGDIIHGDNGWLLDIHPWGPHPGFLAVKVENAQNRQVFDVLGFLESENEPLCLVYPNGDWPEDDDMAVNAVRAGTKYENRHDYSGWWTEKYVVFHGEKSTFYKCGEPDGYDG